MFNLLIDNKPAIDFMRGYVYGCQLHTDPVECEDGFESPPHLLDFAEDEEARLQVAALAYYFQNEIDIKSVASNSKATPYAGVVNVSQMIGTDMAEYQLAGPNHLAVWSTIHSDVMSRLRNNALSMRRPVLHVEQGNKLNVDWE